MNSVAGPLALELQRGTLITIMDPVGTPVFSCNS
jgi:hypothetical protein